MSKAFAISRKTTQTKWPASRASYQSLVTFKGIDDGGMTLPIYILTGEDKEVVSVKMVN